MQETVLSHLKRNCNVKLHFPLQLTITFQIFSEGQISSQKDSFFTKFISTFPFSLIMKARLQNHEISGQRLFCY